LIIHLDVLNALLFNNLNVIIAAFIGSFNNYSFNKFNLMLYVAPLMEL